MVNGTLEQKRCWFFQATHQYDAAFIDVVRRSTKEELLNWWDARRRKHAIHELLTLGRDDSHWAFMMAALIQKCPSVLWLHDYQGNTPLFYQKILSNSGLYLYCFWQAWYHGQAKGIIEDAKREWLPYPRTVEGLLRFLAGMETPEETNTEGAYARILHDQELLAGDASAPRLRHCKLNPLHLACFLGRLSIVKRLMDDAPALLSERDAHGYTPFFYAVNHGHTSIVKYLLYHDVGFRVCFHHVYQASFMGYSDVLQMLVASRFHAFSYFSVRLPQANTTPLLNCIRHGDMASLKLAATSWVPMTYATQEITQSPLQEEMDLTPLQCAALYGQHSIVRFLLKQGVLGEGACVHGTCALFLSLFAYGNHNCRVFEDLLPYYNPITLLESTRHGSLLHAAAMSNCGKCLRRVLAYASIGKLLHQPFSKAESLTPVSLALEYCDLPHIRLLLESAGDNVLFVGVDDRHPAIVVAQNNHCFRATVLPYLWNKYFSQMDNARLHFDLFQLIIDYNPELQPNTPWDFVETLLDNSRFDEWHECVTKEDASDALTHLLQAIIYEGRCTNQHFHLLMLMYRRFIVHYNIKLEWGGLTHLGFEDVASTEQLRDLAWVLYHLFQLTDNSTLHYVVAKAKKHWLLDKLQAKGQGDSQNPYLRGIMQGITRLTWVQHMWPLLGLENV